MKTPKTFGRAALFAMLQPLIALSFTACSVMGHEHAPAVRTATNAEIRTFFQGTGKTVLTFVGYSGAGYEDPAAMLAAAGHILGKYDPKTTIVNIGATEEGIGAVYELAAHKGFVTTGIVSTQAKQTRAALASHCDHVFFVEDATWGGYLAGTEQLSPTSQAIIENSTTVVGIGGGEVARDELIAARRAGKRVQFVPADMNHQRALETAERKGLPPPTDFRGAAHPAF